MSQSATLESISSSAEVIEVISVGVGSRVIQYIQVRYIDPAARPDLFGKKSGWIMAHNEVSVGDIVRVGFSLRATGLGSGEYHPVSASK